MISEKSIKTVNLIKRSNLFEYRNLYSLFQVVLNIFTESYESLEESIQAEDKTDLKYLLNITKFIRAQAIYCLADTGNREFEELYWKATLFEAPHRFESFMLYMEKDRPAKERFYKPREKVLKQVADAIQDLADDELDELFINMPSRVGKTQIVKFGFVWYSSRNSELSNLYSAYSDKITKPFYGGCIELITDPTYCYRDIFPCNKIVATNGDDETIELNRKKSYPSMTCRSIYGTLNGSCDCNGLAITDDLLSGIEEAVNPDRLNTVWGKFDNNFMQRLKGGAKLINMGTRWALGDPQGLRRELLSSNPEYKNRRWRLISIPALDENDESNFDYPYGVGYSTEHYRQRRASFEENDDMASWFAQAQQQPIERQGALFESGSMNFFDLEEDMPIREPDRIFMAIDEAFGGGDYVSAPVCFQFDEAYYIVDVVFDNGDKFITRPLIRDMILKYQIQAAQFEETKTTSDYHEWIEDELKKVGYRFNITARPAPGKLGKRQRIFDKAPEIREMYFIKDGQRTKGYQKFVQNIFSFKMEGVVKHDDGPDSMAQLCNMKLPTMAVAEPCPRIF